MTWAITRCTHEELPDRLREGWEPYAINWVKKDRFTDRIEHWLKRQVETQDD